MLTYVGTFHFSSATDGHNKLWHLWGVQDDSGEVVAIHYGISSDIHCASGEVLVSDCDSELRVNAFTIAKEKLETHSSDDEFEVIDRGDRRWH